MLLSGLVLAFYAWVLTQSNGEIDQSLIVSNQAAIAAGITMIYSIASHFLTPRKILMPSAVIGFLLVIAMIGLLINDTGYLSSPFIALWTIASLSAAIFGAYGTVPIISGILIYLISLLAWGNLDFDAIALTTLLGILPLGVGYLIWRPLASDSKLQAAEDKSLHELNSKLDAVSGQSEIVIAAIADGVISIDGRGVITLFNPAAQRLLGWGRADAIGLDYKSVLKLLDSHNASPSEQNNPIYQALNTNSQTQSNNLRVQTVDSGKSFVASITTTPIGSPGSGAIIVFRDITRETADERQQAEFISTASHEMRTPVASIEGYLGLAINPATATIDDRARDYIGKAQAAAKHLGRLFQDLLDVTKADDGRLSDNPTVIDIVPFIRDIIIGQLPSAAAKNINIGYPPQPGLNATQAEDSSGRTLSPVYYVNLDPDHLREIIGNLLENAIKYTPSGSITVDVSSEPDSLTISIKDSGIGIPKEDIPHLFQKFYRVDDSDTREIGGTGLGLYLSRKLAEAIDGKLWVESVYGQGSTFYLKLPRIDASLADKLRSQQSRQQTPQSPVQAAPQVASPPQTPQTQAVATQQPVAQAPQVQQTQPARAVAITPPARPATPPLTTGTPTATQPPQPIPAQSATPSEPQRATPPQQT